MTYLIFSDPESLDPAKSNGGYEEFISPRFFYSWICLQKPFMEGLAANAIDAHPLKYAWIDTNWRPS